jgi:signal transduction histidine kinase
MTLRRLLTSVLVVMSVFTLSAALALILLTTYLHTVTTDLAEAVASIRLGEELKVDLLRHARLSHLSLLLAPDADPIDTRNELERSLPAKVRRMRVHAQTTAEMTIIDDAERTVTTYLAQWRQAEADERDIDAVIRRTNPSLEAALADLARLVDVNVEEAKVMQERAATWDRVADVFGIAVAGALLVAVLVLLAWLGGYVFRSLLLISDGIRRFAAGERTTHVPEVGPAELRDIATSFNAMVATVAAHEERRLAFLAGVAHDLRNPLMVLQLSTALGGSEKTPEQLRQALAIANRQVARLDRMVGDLLDNVRIEAGQLEVRLETHDVAAIVRNVFELYRHGSTSHAVTASIPERTILVRCDTLRIEQVLGNLLGNAIKYSPAGGRIHVKLESDGREATIAVSDQGIGIGPEERDRIFDPFRRGKADDRIPGAGLGLSVARRIVERHGGAIDVESEPGRGSTFSVRLPLASGEASAGETSAKDAAAMMPVAMSGSGRVATGDPPAPPQRQSVSDPPLR